MPTIRLVILDLDGTLVEANSWQYLHERLGTWDFGRANLERYRAGEISYEEWAQLDARLWRGIETREVNRILGEIPIRRGADRLIKALKANGIKVGIVSAGLLPLAKRLADGFSMDFCLANDLEARDGRLTGRALVSVPLESKGEVMRKVCLSFNIPAHECGSIGDSIQDFPPWIGLGIAICRGRGLDSGRIDLEIGEDLSEAIPHIIDPSPRGARQVDCLGSSGVKGNEIK
ncbi:MAG: HAD-IB family phosphatase [Candidatus Bathyarchaeia archaeon]